MLYFLLFSLMANAQDPGLTIYNQNFAVVRQSLKLDLKAGVSAVEFSELTAKLEPESVVLRDPLGKPNRFCHAFPCSASSRCTCASSERCATGHIRGGTSSYAHLARKYGVTESDVGNYLRLVRQRLRSLLKVIVTGYLGPGEDVEDEVRFIISR